MDFAFVEGVVVAVNGSFEGADEVVHAFDHMEQVVVLDQSELYYPGEWEYRDGFLCDVSEHFCAWMSEK